jgi:hypothetical protein
MGSNAVNVDGPILGKLRLAAWLAVGALLLTPLVAMQFSDEVKWTAFDFVFAGVFLIGAGLLMEFAARKAKNFAHLAAIGVAIAATLLLVWVTGAAGIIGNEQNDANLLFFSVIGIGLTGAIAARFRPKGMAIAMAAAALAQVAIGVTALIAGWGAEDPGYPMDIVGATGIFAVVWLISAYLFREAARDPAHSSFSRN